MDLNLVETALKNIGAFDNDAKEALKKIFGGKELKDITKEDFEAKKATLKEAAKKVGRNFDMAPCLITDVLDPKAVDGFQEGDLILRGVCFYKNGKYAQEVLDKAGVKNTRNYFLHSWLLDTKERREKKDNVTVNAVTMIADADGIRDRFFGGELNLDDFG